MAQDHPETVVQRSFPVEVRRSMEVHKMLCVPRDLHMKVHKVLHLPRNLHMEVHKVLCLPRTLHMEVHKVLRLPRNLHMEVHKVLCLPRKLHFEVHKALHLPRNVHMEVHKVLRMARSPRIDVHKVLWAPATTSAHGGSQTWKAGSTVDPGPARGPARTPFPGAAARRPPDTMCKARTHVCRKMWARGSASEFKCILYVGLV